MVSQASPELCKLQARLKEPYDIIPAGFKSQRELTLPLIKPRYSVNLGPNTEDATIIKLRKETTATFQMQCKTRHHDGQMQYAVKSGKGTLFEESFWCASPTEAFDACRLREGVSMTRKISGMYIFGFPCLAVQEHLFLLRTTSEPGTEKRARVERNARITLKEVVHKHLLKPIREKFQKHSPFITNFRAHLFAYRATQTVVENMLKAMETSLIVGREPEERAQQILDQFLNHPHIKILLQSSAASHWQLDRKQILVVDHILLQLKEAILIHKNLKNTKSVELYQVLMNICCPSPQARLQRAAATLLGLDSRRGLIAAGMRVAAHRVAEEGEAKLFLAPERKDRSDWLAGEDMRVLARNWWECKTRVSACKKSIVPLEDGTVHPVHWLEETILNFHHHFLDAGNHYYETQLLVRNVPEGTTSVQIRQAFAEHHPARVNSKKNGKYFYVVFTSNRDLRAALEASTLQLFQRELKAEVSQRPLMGYTAFANERPSWVKDVTSYSCVCTKCQGMVLTFAGLLGFRHWGKCCPPVAEIITDIRNHSSPFSPSLDSLMEVLLCARDEVTGFFRKSCCYGDCKACGLRKVVAQCDLDDIKDNVPAEEKCRDLFVTYQAYESRRSVDEVVAGDDECDAVEKKTSRPELRTQTSRPSEFLPHFISQLTEYQKHKYIAVHQTFMEQQLKAMILKVDDDKDEAKAAVREECICVDMDFAENYEVWHKIELQSEHWVHNQVTLFIVITHFREAGIWKEEAHIFVSADGSHDTYFVQRAMTALGEHFKLRGVAPASWYINTDGAPSHFKNKYTMQSLFAFKQHVGAKNVVWETCAPGHGKGPWDGVGAVVKRFLRQLERFNKLYAQGARDVFLALVTGREAQTRTLRSSAKISDIIFHYIRTGNENDIPDVANVWSEVKRPISKPNVTDLPGIRSSFCFRLAGDKTICYELSCRCIKCRNHLWTECKNTDVGEWKRVDMVRVVASACVKTRNRRTMSLARVKLAAAVTPGEVIAMESADDAEGFLWCLPEPKVLLSATEVRRRLWMGLRLWTVDITYYCVIMKGFLQILLTFSSSVRTFTKKMQKE